MSINITEKVKNLFKKIVLKFPITIIGVFLGTLIYAIGIDTDIISGELLSKIMLFLSIATLGNFYIETIKSGLNKDNIYKYIISFLISALFTMISYDIFGIDDEIFINNVKRVMWFYIMAVTLLIVYESLKISKLNLSEYSIKVITSIFKSSFLYGILAISCLIILGIFNILIFEIEGETIFRFEILIFGIFYIPRLLYSLSDTEKNIGNFIKIVFKYTLEILLIIAFSIIYMYIAKIFILNEIPSNAIFRILTGLFVIGCPIWTIVEHFNNKDLLSKINSKLPILFIPFIFLQIYAIWERISQYGLTGARYLSCAVIVFEIIYYIIYFKNKENVQNMILVGIVMLFVIMLVPYINVYKLPVLLQYDILKTYKEKENLTDEDYKKINSAYKFLIRDIEGKKMVEDLLTEQEIKNILDKNKDLNEKQYLNTEYIYANNTEEKINIEGYKVLYDVRYSQYNLDKIKKINSQFDIYKVLNNYIENESNIKDYFKENNEIIIDNNNKLVLQNLNISYDIHNKEIKTFTIEGYLLSNEN